MFAPSDIFHLLTANDLIIHCFLPQFAEEVFLAVWYKLLIEAGRKDFPHLLLIMHITVHLLCNGQIFDSLGLVDLALKRLARSNRHVQLLGPFLIVGLMVSKHPLILRFLQTLMVIVESLAKPSPTGHRPAIRLIGRYLSFDYGLLRCVVRATRLDILDDSINCARIKDHLRVLLLLCFAGHRHQICHLGCLARHHMRSIATAIRDGFFLNLNNADWLFLQDVVPVPTLVTARLYKVMKYCLLSWTQDLLIELLLYQTYAPLIQSGTSTSDKSAPKNVVCATPQIIRAREGPLAKAKLDLDKVGRPGVLRCFRFARIDECS